MIIQHICMYVYIWTYDNSYNYNIIFLQFRGGKQGFTPPRLTTYEHIHNYVFRLIVIANQTVDVLIH